MEIISALFVLGICLVVTLVVFLVIREVVLWYWKINNILFFLEWQKNLLEKEREQNKRIIYLLEKIAGEGPQSDLQPEEETGETKQKKEDGEACPK